MFKFYINHRIDFVSDKKSMGAGKKRSISFYPGDSEEEHIEAKGMLKSDLVVYVNEGLPNTSKPKKDSGGNTQRKRPQQTQQQPTSRPSNTRPTNTTPRVGPGAPLPAIPKGKHAFTAYLYFIIYF